MTAQTVTKPTGGGAAGESTAVPAATKTGLNPVFPVNNQNYITQRPAYLRLQPPPMKIRRRRCCCRCCLWTAIVISFLILLAAFAGAVFYVLYRPERLNVTVNSLRLADFNLTETSITAAFNFSVTARNPNNRIAFNFDGISLYLRSADVDVGDGSFPGFILGENNVTTMRSVISRSNSPIPEGTDVSALKSSLKIKQLPLKIVMETKMQAQIGKLATKKLKIRFTCDGRSVPLPVAKAPPPSTVSGVRCKAKPIINILDWTL
ncbi:NDR1/HIN1-like protein 6 [Andrographis paniculata]|uniref:NDR1/HIN1-like protein 6 n=1 Tax=Andrographis paniculata TaxID=175694 RepID=UPI0021E95C3D|nr:NDR1/HIN1-like protein 6 [Andrographis paniculata]